MAINAQSIIRGGQIVYLRVRSVSQSCLACSRVVSLVGAGGLLHVDMMAGESETGRQRRDVLGSPCDGHVAGLDSLHLAETRPSQLTTPVSSTGTYLRQCWQPVLNTVNSITAGMVFQGAICHPFII